MGAKGMHCRNVADVGRTLKAALQNQREGLTTVIEIDVSKELGDPFRRDAMALPKRLLPQYTSPSSTSPRPVNPWIYTPAERHGRLSLLPPSTG